MVMNKRKFNLIGGGTITFCALLTNPCLAANDHDPCSTINIDDILSPGRYVVTQYERAGGGLMPEAEAKSAVGEEVVIQKTLYEAWGLVVNDPEYVVKCVPGHRKEGDVDSNGYLYSNWYGIGIERDWIVILEVYEKGGRERGVVNRFELVDKEIWNLFDRWLFRLRPSKQ
jgi:hypothetical protein